MLQNTLHFSDIVDSVEGKNTTYSASRAQTWFWNSLPAMCASALFGYGRTPLHGQAVYNVTYGRAYTACLELVRILESEH